MILSGKKYSHKGRIRFGSKLFIDDKREKIIDSIRGYSRNTSILYVMFFLIILKTITGNGIGIITVVLLFYFTYILSVRNIHIQFTDERLLVISEFRHPRAVNTIGYIFLGASVYTLLNFIFPGYSSFLKYGSQIMESIFTFIGFLPIFFIAYSDFIKLYETELIRVDSLISFFIYLFHGIQFLKMKYHFSEIHYSHISEEIIKLKKEKNAVFTPIIIVTAILSQIILFQGLNFITSLLFLTVYLYSSNLTIAQISFFGSYGRSLLRNISLSPSEFFRATRATASIFGWEHQGNYYSRPFPYNVIPEEVASFYETGLRASTIDALKEANSIGLVLSGFINLFVLVLLFKFAFENNKAATSSVALIGLGLIVISFLVWQIANQFMNYQRKFQREESIMIGRNFVGRYIEPNLWIMRGSKLEGTSLRRGVKKRIISYDKTRGLSVSWQSLSLNLILVMTVILTIVWIQLGGLNITNAIYIFPFLFDQSLNFLSNKASAELGFFIVAGYLFWALLYLNYPKYYARSRPQLFLEMQYPSSVPIILRNFKDHQEASKEFTRCLINSSRPTRRKTTGRPGAFLMNVILKSIELLDKTLNKRVLYFEFGKLHIRGEDLILGDYKLIRLQLIKRLRLSAELGFPRLKINVIINGEKLEIIHTQEYDLEKNYENQINIIIEDKLKLSLGVSVDSVIQ